MLLVTAAAATGMIGVSGSTPNTWLGGSGYWSDSSRWSSGMIPSQNDDVMILANSTQSAIVYVDVAEVTIASLTINSVGVGAPISPPLLLLAGGGAGTAYNGSTYLFNVIGNVLLQNFGTLMDTTPQGAAFQTVQLTVGNSLAVLSGAKFKLISSNTVVNNQGNSISIDGAGTVLQWSTGTINADEVVVTHGAMLVGGVSPTAQAQFSGLKIDIIQGGLLSQWNVSLPSTVAFTVSSVMSDCVPTAYAAASSVPGQCWLSLSWSLAPNTQSPDGAFFLLGGSIVLSGSVNAAVIVAPQFTNSGSVTFQTNSSIALPPPPPVLKLVIGGVRTCNTSAPLPLYIDGLFQTVDVGNGGSAPLQPALGSLILIPKCAVTIPADFQPSRVYIEVHRPLIPLVAGEYPMISWNTQNAP